MQVKVLLPLMLFVIGSGYMHAEDMNCAEVAALAGMARARSIVGLTAEEKKAGDGYQAQVVFAARELELDPRDKRAAIALLDLIPSNDDQKTIWMTFGESLCDAESIADMKSLTRLRDRLSRDLSRAVLLVPNRLPEYVAFADEAVQDPHNDYAVQMKTVCHSNHSGFTKAINSLPQKEREWFVKHILNPDGCHALALPEAE